MWNNYNNPYGFNNTYNNYLNRTNPYSMQQPQPAQNQMQPTSPQAQNNIIWVKGKENARSMQLNPNSIVVLLDSEVGKFYIKTTDDIGLGKLRVFNYVQQPDDDFQTTSSQKVSNDITTPPKVDLSNYVTKDEFESKIKEILTYEQSLQAIKSTNTKSK